MKTLLKTASLVCVLGAAAPLQISLAGAAPTQQATSEQPPDAARAQALLARAVAHMQAHGRRALAAFSRAGEFTDGELYVYVVGNDGVLEASGGASYTFIGRNMLDYADPDGKKLFVEMIEGARANGGGQIEYRWLNMQRGKIERKIAYYRAVGDHVVGVGYYAPRATAEQAMAVLWRATDELKRRGTEAFAAFNDLNGGYVRDDTYVFVVGVKDKRMHAHGAMPRLIGRDVAELKDTNGKPIIEQMLDIVATREEGALDYVWRNPATGQIENKHTFLKRVGDYMIGVGYYQP